MTRQCIACCIINHLTKRSCDSRSRYLLHELKKMHSVCFDCPLHLTELFSSLRLSKGEILFQSLEKTVEVAGVLVRCLCDVWSSRGAVAGTLSGCDRAVATVARVAIGHCRTLSVHTAQFSTVQLIISH